MGLPPPHWIASLRADVPIVNAANTGKNEYPVDLKV
jgi:hypothetical protein